MTAAKLTFILQEETIGNRRREDLQTGSEAPCCQWTATNDETNSSSSGHTYIHNHSRRENIPTVSQSVIHRAQLAQRRLDAALVRPSQLQALPFVASAEVKGAEEW